jgi:hypothetical protein
MMIHGARAALYRCKNPHDRMILWARAIAKRSNANKAAVALANRESVSKRNRSIWYPYLSTLK